MPLFVNGNQVFAVNPAGGDEVVVRAPLTLISPPDTTTTAE